MVATNGLIIKARDKDPVTLDGHPKLTAYQLIRPEENGSIKLIINLDDVEPGGGINPHFHEATPVYDHAYYVISGKISASLGTQEEIVGPDTLIYFPSNVIHSIKNIGKKPAKLLMIRTAESGKTSAKSVFIKQG